MKILSFKFICIFSASLIANFTIAQNLYFIEGKIYNSDDTAIPYASVQLTDSASNLTIGYSISDHEGYYKIEHIPSGNYHIEINHIEYNKSIESLFLSKSKTQNFNLYKKEKELEEITIINKLIKSKGDTISYNLNSFTNGHEEKLKDILNKLPGIEVNDGNIKVNGKIIDKLLINGNDFFGNNHKLATDNLNAQMIKSVDVLKNYQNSLLAKNLEGGQQTALNVDIKKEYQNKITGDISLFSSYKEMYNSQLNLFKFGSKSSISFIGNAGNTGKNGFTIDDYLKLNTDVRNELMNNEISSMKEMSDFLPNFLLTDNNIIKKNNQLGSLNISFIPNEKLKISAYSILNNVSQREKIFSEKLFLDNNSEISDKNNTKGNLLFNQTYLKINYDINNHISISYSGALEPAYNKGIGITESNNKINIHSYDENLSTKNLKFSQQFSFLYKFSEKNLVTFNLYQELKDDRNKYTISSSEPLFHYNNLSLQQRSYRKNDEKGIISKFTHKFSIFTLKGNLGYIWKRNIFKNTIVQELTNEHIPISTNYLFLKTGISNSTHFLQYLLDFEIRDYKLSFNPEKSKSTFFLPKAKLKLEFTPTHTLSIYYTKDITYLSADKFNQQNYLNDYYSLFTKSLIESNKELLNSTTGIEYLFLNLYNGTNLIINTNFNQTSNTPVTNNNSLNNYTVINYINSKNKKSWNVNLIFEAKLKFIKSRISFNNDYSLSFEDTFTNQEKDPMKSSFIFNEIALKSYSKKAFLNYESGIKLSNSISSYKNQKNSLKRSQITPFFNLYFKFSENLKGSWTNNYTVYRSGQIKKDIYNLGFKIIYKNKLSSWKYWIEGNDILNIAGSETIETSTTNNILQRNIYHKLPGYAGVGMSYNL